MSSLLDAVINSDNNFNSSDPQNGDHTRQPTADRRRFQTPSSRARSSSRLRGPPSESAGAQSDAGGYYDDEQIAIARAQRARNQGQLIDIPKVVDSVGEGVARTFEHFLETFIYEAPKTNGQQTTPAPTASATQTSEKYYIAMIHGMRAAGLSTLYVDFTHLQGFQEGVLATEIANQYYRYVPFLTRALHSLLQRHEPRYFQEHRQPDTETERNSSTGAKATSEGGTNSDKTPNQQTDKLFTVAFYNMPRVSRIREMKTDEIGRLVSISGTVTRTSEVRPELHLGTFTCDVCNNTVYNVEQVFKYTEPSQCPNATCNNKDFWRLDIRQSTFVDWQKIRVQENSSEIPTGSMPRTLDVIVRGEIVDRAKAGEKCVFTGTLIVIPDISQLKVPGQRVTAMKDAPQQERGGDVGGRGVSGLKPLGVRDLSYRLSFLGCMITPDLSASGQNNTQQLHGVPGSILASLNQLDPLDPYDSGKDAQTEFVDTLTENEIDDLRLMVQQPNIYMRLVDSIAPMVYGHEVVKKGLLLQLMGGVSKQTPEGMALRGDINICIVGDPSTSKSQFLKYICSFLPRAVYTSGKASSAAGLTAAVVKDEETGEFTIEAGALMLADNGICAIDEFDKMDIADQVAIHEAMEQQTISIAKAGIQATLNARTSILAAANPVGGRYNRKATLRANINMSAPIMSRFDLFFVILDECNESVDRHLAEHIVGVHRLRDDAVKPEFSTEQLQRYIRFARTFKPVFTDEAKATLVDKYKELRADDAQGGIGRNSYRITVRQLESMIRLSEAIAKANCVSEITSEFVLEAFKLLRQSIISVEKDDVDVDEEAPTAAGNEEDQDQDMDHGEEHEPTPAPAQAASRTKITHDEYMRIVKAIVGRVTGDETDSQEGVGEEDLVLWYLELKEEAGEIQTQEEMERIGGLVKKVVRRMTKDNILMLIRGEGLADAAGGGLQAESRMYIVHPNFAAEDLA